MRRGFYSLLGILATLLGTMIVLPRINRPLWTTQLVLNEFPFVTTLLGLLAAVKGTNSALVRVSGLYGAALSIVPLLRIPRAIDDMDRAMRDGLGDDYEQVIIPQVRPHLARGRWSLANLAGSSAREGRVSILRDIAYTQTPIRDLKLDVYRPLIAPIIGERYPTIIALHGGGWYRGDKGGYFAANFRYLAARGYVVIDAQYRLTATDGARWPEMLEDVRAAIRWAGEHADRYRIDPDRLALYGRSAGGHLALQTAYRATGEHADTAVKAIIAAYAPTNMRLTGPKHDPRVLNLLGGASYEIPDVYSDASPLDFARDDLPPTLLLHGAMDGLVSPVHAELLLNRLRATTTPCVLLRLPWGRHGFDALMPGTGAQITQYYIDRFLAWSLYGRNSQR